MGTQTSALRRNLAALAGAALIGALSSMTGPASAESMLGDQSFERGGASALTGRTSSMSTGKLPEGVGFETLAEYSADVSGVQKVRLSKVTLKPGATLTNFTVTEPLFCNATQGKISVTNHTTGAKAVYSPGDHWSFTTGRYTLRNPGDVDHVHYLYAMVQAERPMPSQVMPGMESWQPSGFRGPGYMGKI